MKNYLKYIIVDDDPISNVISLMVIKRNIPKTDVKIFNIPEEGLSYLQKEHRNPLGPTILLLDINMPHINGWEFLELYKKFSSKIHPPLSIYILSSSVDQQDRNKAKASKHVKGFISKPLTRETIIAMTKKASVIRKVKLLTTDNPQHT